MWCALSRLAYDSIDKTEPWDVATTIFRGRVTSVPVAIKHLPGLCASAHARARTHTLVGSLTSAYIMPSLFVYETCPFIIGFICSLKITLTVTRVIYRSVVGKERIPPSCLLRISVKFSSDYRNITTEKCSQRATIEMNLNFKLKKTNVMGSKHLPRLLKNY